MEGSLCLKTCQFYRGMIVRMKLENFMTYDVVEINAQPKLNFILGPNGTGKSTFLCAIILGLGGKPSIIGRSTNVADYIKRGCKESRIEIELYNPDGINYLVTRLIHSNSTSTWQLHGKTSNVKLINEVAEKLNMQINNLCMILPQDRVQDFTKMNKKQLLEHTQKSVGKGDLAEVFEKLCSVSNNIKEQNKGLKEKSQRYQEQLQVLKRMEVDVKCYLERQETLKKIEIMKKKEAWLAYEEKSSSLEQGKEEYKRIVTEYEKAKELLKPFLLHIKDGQKKELDLISKIKAQGKLEALLQVKLNDLKKQFLMVKNDISSVKDNLKAIIEAEKKKEIEINAVMNEIKRFETAIPNKSESVLINEIKAIEKENEELVKQFSQIRLQENEIRSTNSVLNQHLKATEHRIKQADSINDKKIEILQNYKDVFEAYKWLSNNRHIFCGNVYGPLFIELNVKKTEYAKYVEKVIPHRDMIAFICENSQDTTKLLSTLRDNQGLKINVLNSPRPQRDPAELYRPNIPLNELKKFGFHSYLNHLIEGPASVLNYLCSQLGFHKIPVGSDEILKYTDEIPTNIRLFFSSKKVFRMKISNYSGERLQTVRDLDEARFLGYSVNQSLIKSLNCQKEKYTQEIVEGQQKEVKISEIKKKMEIELNRARNTKTELCRELEYQKAYSVRLRMKREELARLQEHTFDRDLEESATKEKISERVQELVEINSLFCDEINKYHKINLKVKLFKLELEGVLAKFKKDEREFKVQEAQSLKLKEKVEKVKSELVKFKVEVKSYFNKAKELTDGLDPDNPSFVEKYQESFKKLPNRLQELNDQLCDCEAMMRCLQSTLSDQAVKDYDEQKYLLGHLGKDLEKVRTNITFLEQQCLDLKNIWLPRINELITIINDKFSRSFSFLGCAGGVELDRGDGMDDFESFGINIRVKFRNDGDLLVLNPFTQSGGEKALSIAVYLLSLQSVISVPFRWVDEINQGMDEYNEVRVYFLMMCEIANDPTAQYFVITPKLASGIKMSAETTVHIIYSGEYQPKGERNGSESKKRKTKLEWSKKKYFEYLRINLKE